MNVNISDPRAVASILMRHLSSALIRVGAETRMVEAPEDISMSITTSRCDPAAIGLIDELVPGYAALAHMKLVRETGDDGLPEYILTCFVRSSAMVH